MRVSLSRGRFRVVVGPSPGRPWDGKTGAVDGRRAARCVAAGRVAAGGVSVPLVVSVTVGRPISVVDSDTLVVNDVLEVSDGVITNGCSARRGGRLQRRPPVGWWSGSW